MIRVGEYEAFSAGSTRSYWDIGAAVGDFEARCRVPIEHAIASEKAGKTLTQIVVDGGSVTFDLVWIDFSKFNPASLQREISVIENTIAQLATREPADAQLPSKRLMLATLKRQLQMLRPTEN